MNRLILSFLFLLLALTGAEAQQRKFSVVSFEADPFDLTARNDQHKKVDGNGSLYAIIKVTSTDTDDQLGDYRFNFGNMNHEVVQRDGELWVYVQRNAKMVTISRPGFATINKYDLKTTIEEGKAYRMKLSTEAERVYTQMVQFIVEPADSRATVMVKRGDSDEDVLGITDESGGVAKSLPFGSYTYKVVAEDFYSQEGHFVLNDMAQNHVEKVVMKPKFSMLTLRVDADADIYVNGRQMGKRVWTGRLNAGTYQIECRMANHRASLQTIEVKENERQSVDLPLPVPITGILSVVSQPLGASIIVDGQQSGVTPHQFPQLLTGQHTIVLEKQGYESVTRTFTVSEGEVTTLELTMTKSALAGQAKSNAVAQKSGEDGVYTVNGVSFRMIDVEGGTFKMGSSSSDEKPVHQVTLSSFSIGETEVTQELWEAVMGSNPSKSKGTKLSVENVSWNDCQKFIIELNALTGKEFRLPTEAEWEFAARGGNQSKGDKYAGSNDIDEVAWCKYNSGSTPHRVSTKQPNELGIYDMSGNVAEWCQDWYGRYPSSAVTNPTGRSSGAYRVCRGGGIRNSVKHCRVSHRAFNIPMYTSRFLGLRLAQDIK